MNTYYILAAQDALDTIYDIYIDTVEAWSAHDALKAWCEKTFAFKEMYYLGYNHAVSRINPCACYRAFPVMLDKTNPQRFFCLSYIPHQNEFYNTRKEK